MSEAYNRGFEAGLKDMDCGFEHVITWLVWKRERNFNCGLMLAFGVTLESIAKRAPEKQ